MIRSLLDQPLDTVREVWHAWRFYRGNEHVTTTPRYLEERDVTWSDPDEGEPKLIDATGNAPPESMPHLGWHAPVRQYMFMVENAALHGNLPVPTDSDGRVLWEMLSPRTHLPPNHISLRALLDRRSDLSGGHFERPVIVPYTKHRPNYFHWLLDGLGRLKILEDAGYNLSDFDYLFRELTSWQSDSLEAIGVPPENCHVLGGYDLQIKSLVVLSGPRVGVTYSSDNLRWLKQRIIDFYIDEFPPTKNKDRIFIKRKESAERRIFTNKEEVLPALRECGFEDVYLEDLAFPEQVRLFAGSEVVIGAHGAGLANLLFCTDASVVEVFFRKRPMFYWLLAKFNDLNYQYLNASDVRGTFNHEKGKLDISSTKKILRNFDTNRT